MPTGGVNLQTLPDFIKAGACAVGVGSSLVEPQAIREGKMDRIRDLAAQYVQVLKNGPRGAVAGVSGNVWEKRWRARFFVVCCNPKEHC